jgi:hypothetical protein
MPQLHFRKSKDCECEFNNTGKRACYADVILPGCEHTTIVSTIINDKIRITFHNLSTDKIYKCNIPADISAELDVHTLENYIHDDSFVATYNHDLTRVQIVFDGNYQEISPLEENNCVKLNEAYIFNLDLKN